MEEQKKRVPWKALGLGVILGVVLVWLAALGMSYSDSRPFCSSCHVMSQAALTHSQSAHSKLACNECHAPQSLLSKIPFKAKEGLRDFVGNIQGEWAPLRANSETREVVNTNCKGCHAVVTSGVMNAKPYCVDCHQGMAHMKKKAISFREVADE